MFSLKDTNLTFVRFLRLISIRLLALLLTSHCSIWARIWDWTSSQDVENVQSSLQEACNGYLHWIYEFREQYSIVKNYFIWLAEDNAIEKSKMPDTMNPFILVDGVKATTLTIYGQFKMCDASYLKRYVQISNRLSII